MTAIPALGPETALPLSVPVETTLDNGLRVTVYPHSATGLVDAGLRFNGAGAPMAAADLLASTALTGTADLDQEAIAARLQGMGGSLGVGSSADHLTLRGSALSENTAGLFDTMADILTGARYPEHEFDTEQKRLVDSLSVAEKEASYVVGRELNARLWPDHPYGHQDPTSAEVEAVTQADVAALHRDRLGPDGAEFILVADTDPDVLLSQVKAIFGEWDGGRAFPPNAALPAWQKKPLLLRHRDNSVQSAIRVAAPAVGRTHPDNAAQQLANLVYGGYFSSRLVANLREEKGYGYSPRSSVHHRPAGSVQVSYVDVANDVTAPALEETYRELDGLTANPPTRDELDQARNYALGSLRLALASQGGLAGYATTLAADGLPLSWIGEHAENLQRVTVDDVVRVAGERLSSAQSVTVVLGDRDATAAGLADLGEIEEA
ncbi:M16 family metallopeptidase [Salininema proteolyticum]|uniref:M16 family metallopeptidase n=1 Tax=Salininema proteolyticum TaxID=1607685 RepID=A0ABV8TY84_9ACTN